MLNGATKATYLAGPRGPEYRRDDQAGTIKWYCYDGLGSVLAEVDPSGNVTASRNYDVYGLVRGSTGTSTSNHKFVGSLGHPSEAETGLIYMRARYMDPACGRFCSEDPAILFNGNVTEIIESLYVYVGSNPVNSFDPDGKDKRGIPASDILRLLASMLMFITLMSLVPLARVIGASFLNMYIALLGGAAGGPVAMGYAASLVITDFLVAAKAALNSPPEILGSSMTPTAQIIGTVSAYASGLIILAWILDHT